MFDIKVSIVEDEKQAQEKLISCLKAYESTKEKDIHFEVSTFSNAEDFLSAYDKSADIVFLDIELPKKSGMDAAHKIRQIDKDVLIVFVTNLAQYAIEGYEVDAYDFVLKPFSYETMALKFQRLVNLILHKNKEFKVLSIPLKNGMKFIQAEDILYIEVYNHDLIIHPKNGDKIRFRGTISSMKKELEDSYFSLCNSCYLVNLSCVESIEGDYVILGKEKLKISQPRRKDFIREVASYMGGSI